MNINPLWSVASYPGLADSVLHFTGRVTDEPNADVAEAIAQQTAHERLAQILSTHILRAHHPYWSAGDPAICFTEAPQLGAERLVKAKRYAPWAIGFDKQFIFENQGGPAFYVRGDLWDAYRNSDLPSRVKAFATPFWPGALPIAGGPALPAHLAKASQWYHEREWRIPRSENQREFAFALVDVKSLVVPGDAELDWLCAQVPGLPAHLGHIRVMTIASPEEAAQAEETPDYDWTDPYDPANPYADIVKEMLGLD